MSRSKHLTADERRDARSTLDFLEQEHQNDLSLHLYSAHLIRRLSLLSIRKKKAKAFENGKPKTDKQLFRSSVPVPSWTLWPSLDTSGNSHELKTIAPMPRSKKQYIDVDEPTAYPISDNLPASIACKTFDDGSNKTFADRKFRRAAGILNFELDALFQRQIHQAAHSHGCEITTEPTPTLPLQMREKLVESFNRLLDDIIEDQSKKPKSTVPLNWQDILSRRITTGQSFERCKKLFYEPVEKIPAVFPHSYDAQMNNLMTGEACFSDGIETLVLSNPSKHLPMKEEMIESARIKLMDSNENSKKLDKLLRKNKQKVGGRDELLNTSRSLLTLSSIDPDCLEHEQNELKHWNDGEVIEQVRTSRKRRKMVELSENTEDSDSDTDI